MEYIKGDLIEMVKDGVFDVIVHGCNCYNCFGAGIAKQIKKEFPEAYEADKKTKNGAIEKLGDYTYAVAKNGVVIINAYTQYRYGTDKMHVNYIAVRNCMKKIVRDFNKNGMVLYVGLPKIGAGLAGGNWDVIENIIKEELDPKKMDELKTFTSVEVEFKGTFGFEQNDLTDAVLTADDLLPFYKVGILK